MGNTFSRFKSAIIDKGIRILKVYEYGVKTAKESMPFGDDSQPLENMTAIFARTGENGDNVIVGYINTNQIATEGEKRIYSLKSDGSLSIDIMLRTDGTLEIGGDENTVVRFDPLKTAIEKSDLDINTELVKIQTALATVGGVYTPGTINTDISSSESENIKIQ